MKIILKSLLITTVLTFPTGVCAAPEMTSTEGRHGSSSSPSIADIVSRSGNSEVEAKVYADYAMCPDTLWFNVLFATKRIEGLSCFELAISVLEWSKTQPNTHCFAHKADNEIGRLKQAAKLQCEQAVATAKLTVAGATSTSTAVSTGRPGAGSLAATGTGAMAASFATSSSADNKGRYERMYAELKNVWKAVTPDEDLQEFFFDRDEEGSALTSTAVLELMYGFLIAHPEIYIPDLENFGLFTVAKYDAATHAVAIPQVKQLKNKLLHQSLAAFAKGQKLYATIVQVGGASNGHYTVVVIERDGNVHMINTMGAFVGDSKDDPYVHIMPKLVEALNMHKGTAPIEFKAATNVRTGIQDANAGSNSCGIYSFVYWTALMMTQDMNAYKRVTAAASEGYLGGYEDILKAATHKNAMDAIVQVENVSKRIVVEDCTILCYENPNAAVQAKFERDVRSRLQLKLNELTLSAR